MLNLFHLPAKILFREHNRKDLFGSVRYLDLDKRLTHKEDRPENWREK